MTYREAYMAGRRRLQEAGIPDADLDAWYLLEYVTGVTRAVYYADPDREMTAEQLSGFDSAVLVRAKRVPLQHITGVQEFMGLEFQVNESVLIPRQDTETLVEEALKYLKPGMRVLDMCTGSGCILISLIKHGEKKYLEWGKLTGNQISFSAVGSDVSEPALLTAKENAERLHADAQFRTSDLFDEIPEKFDMIVSNPPYIRTSVIDELEEEVRLHDPMAALDGKEDGLWFYRKIIKESPGHLEQGGRILFEIGHDQGEEVLELLVRRGFDHVCVKKDLAGLDRVVSAVYNGTEN